MTEEKEEEEEEVTEEMKEGEEEEHLSRHGFEDDMAHHAAVIRTLASLLTARPRWRGMRGGGGNGKEEEEGVEEGDRGA